MTTRVSLLACAGCHTIVVVFGDARPVCSHCYQYVPAARQLWHVLVVDSTGAVHASDPVNLMQVDPVKP